MSQITITFGDQAENHKGMQIIGKMAEHGYTATDLSSAIIKFEGQGYKCELIDLVEYLPQGSRKEAEPAFVLVVRKGVQCLLSGSNCDAGDLFEEQKQLDWDEKAFMYGRVVNKHARRNLCFAQQTQQPSYEEGKGRVVAWKDVPLLQVIKSRLPQYLPDSDTLMAEGNYYYDINKCGIGFHGDAQRKKVVALRLGNGECTPIHYQWFHNSAAVGKRAIIQLNHGDLYVMSEKAVGWDWKKKSIFTLRHATGCKKFTTI